uniref:Transmembrane protein 97 n=1 Tax=Sinocyclocheilus grahami TaxID=75366 RepID=A0A672QZ59_SINGR
MFLRAFFLSHIPVTLMVDLQPLIPEHLYPSELKNLLQSFVFCEALVQLPFFPIAAYAFTRVSCVH